MYKQCTTVANIYAHGDSNQNFLVAVVVPDADKLKQIAQQLGVKTTAATTTQQLCDRADVNAAVLSAMTAVAQREKLQGFEMVKRIVLVAEDFTIENELLTPTLKLKRNVAAKRFAVQIAAMYALGEPKAEGKGKLKSKL